MRSLIFLVFSQYKLAKYQYVIGCRIAFSNTWCINYQSRKAITDLDWIYFLNERFLGLFIFAFDFVLKIKNNQYLLALSWIEIKHKRTENEWEKTFIYIH